MRIHSLIRAIALLALGLGLLACSDDQAPKKPKTATEHLVETTFAQTRDISIRQELLGTLQALRRVQIFNQEEGLLIELPYYEGDRVKKGAQLARLDDALVRAELGSASANLKQAQLDLKRIQNLLPRKLASEDEVAKARTAVDVAKAEVDQLKIRLDYTRIHAPFDGTISERRVEPGDVIPRLSHILTLIDTRQLKATVYISELLLPQISKGDAVSIKIDALGDQRFAAHVNRIHPVIDENSRRGVIEVILDPVPQRALPGQLCRITVDTRKQPRLLIPFDAMRNDNEGPFVYKIVDGKAIKTYIRTGLQHEFDIEVLDGLQAGEQIISKGFFGLKNKKPVKIVNSTTQVDE
jgi:membrane fusion protein (multidrug efflux system)